MSKQTLQREFKNVPTDASLVCSSTNLSLNRLETVSEGDTVLSRNNPEVNLRKQVSGLTVIVPVLSLEGSPLMPCTPAKARHLLEKRRAHVVKLNPFVIRLNFKCESLVQEISFGMDAGYKNIGYSTITNIKEILSGEIALDNKTKSRMNERRMYRRNRKCRLRYRKPRFNNRVKPEGWLPPSIKRKFDAHINFINGLKKILPIKKVTVEIGNFDIQKIENPDISGVQYQQGDLYGYYNLKFYLLEREKGKCQLCGKKFTKENRPHMHHIKQRSEGGTDRAEGIALIHKSCHEDLHKKKLFHKLKPARVYKAETFMSIVGGMFKKFLDCDVIYGYKTCVKRKELGLEKSHVNDAFVIAGGTVQTRCLPSSIEQKRINNRTLQTNRKGFSPSIRKQRHKIQNRDFIWIDNKKYLSGGVACKGTQVYYFDANEKRLMPSKGIEKIYSTDSLVWLN